MLRFTVPDPIAPLLYLAHLGIDIARLFLVTELILTWKRFACLVPLATVGRPITDAMTTAVDRRLQGRLRGRKLSRRGKLAVCIVILTLADLCLGWIA